MLQHLSIRQLLPAIGVVTRTPAVAHSRESAVRRIGGTRQRMLRSGLPCREYQRPDPLGLGMRRSDQGAPESTDDGTE